MKRFRKIFTMIITMALLINISICSVIVNGETVNSMDDISDYNFTNLIVFARFSDEEEFVDTMYQGETVRQIIDNSYNTAIYSVGDYYRNISSDKLRMNYIMNRAQLSFRSLVVTMHNTVRQILMDINHQRRPPVCMSFVWTGQML